LSVSKRGLLDPRWVFHHRGASSSFQICDVNIYNEKLASRVYNATTNTWDTNTQVIWSGKARIQPTRTSTDRDVKTNSTFVRQVNVQIDFDGTVIADIRPGSYLLITTSPYDDTLTKFVYIVRSVMGSSNPWQRTLVCEVDMEADPDA
jgi:hypothetical protein